MTGIIINDSIVLISTIDEYSKERGIIPSIIDGSVDRLRPVLLTTFTTVLGLAPFIRALDPGSIFEANGYYLSLWFGLWFIDCSLSYPSFGCNAGRY